MSARERFFNSTHSRPLEFVSNFGFRISDFSAAFRLDQALLLLPLELRQQFFQSIERVLGVCPDGLDHDSCAAVQIRAQDLQNTPCRIVFIAFPIRDFALKSL
jgi:hypothetical protein